LVVSQGDRIDGKSGKFFDEGDQGLEVLLDGDMEGISVFEVYGDCDLLMRARGI
jgi:hypothetical protein